MNSSHIYQGNEIITEIQRRLKNLRVDENVQVKIDESGDSFTVTPVRDGIESNKLNRILDDLDDRYGETFRSLAK